MLISPAFSSINEQFALFFGIKQPKKLGKCQIVRYGLNGKNAEISLKIKYFWEIFEIVRSQFIMKMAHLREEFGAENVLKIGYLDNELGKKRH